MYCLNNSEKIKTYYKQLKMERQNVIIKDKILIVCALSSLGKGKAGNIFYQ